MLALHRSGKAPAVQSQHRLVLLDPLAAATAESVLREWRDWFGRQMDDEDLEALERAIGGFTEAMPQRD